MKKLLAVLALFPVGFGTWYASSAMAGTSKPTFGPIPESIRMSSGAVNRSQLPDFVSVVDDKGQITGYVRSSFLFPEADTGPKNPAEAMLWTGRVAPWNVADFYNSDGLVIGRFIMGVGVVLNGQAGPDVGSVLPVTSSFTESRHP